MSQKFISGVIGAILAIAVLIFNQRFSILINLIISIVSFMAMWEIFSVMGFLKPFFDRKNVKFEDVNAGANLLFIVPSLIFVSITPLFQTSLKWQFSFFIYIVISFSSMIINNHLKLRDVVFSCTMATLVSFSLCKVVELRYFGENYGSFYVLLALGVAWTTDTGAYFCGKYFGKNKLCPEVSPKKTIEGFFGGIATCAISMVLIAFIFNNFIFDSKQQIHYFLIILLGIFGAPLAALGDLCFSVLKRKCGVKDFGNVMPGHGGVLDRFDSVIFAAPYVYFFLKLLPIIAV